MPVAARTKRFAWVVDEASLPGAAEAAAVPIDDAAGQADKPREQKTGVGPRAERRGAPGTIARTLLETASRTEGEPAEVGY